ncbi:MAG TPA: nickel pincer cofactor biosynthesis protein LarB, partial [Thermoanaerobacterales bacterium]|nr:nickel pincer cofactor biosynthesis protein LarB [Thermoanaerobacterales bacterium]
MRKLRGLLEKLQAGEVTVDEVLKELKNLPYEDLGFARIDNHRSLRRGVPEVIYCQGKTTTQVAEIARHMLENGSNVMGTRADIKTFHEVQLIASDAKYYETARIFVVEREKVAQNKGTIAVVTAGTSDIPVAEEAAVTAEVFGNPVKRLYDVGVAGIHRLLMNREVIQSARVIIVVAGMEGALASVVGGLVDKPVVAVPTSVGYGA